MICAECKKKLDANTAHPFREYKKSTRRHIKYNLCDKCCPNCFGGVGGTKEKPVETGSDT